ncbi:MAG: SCO family protein [Gammaproteobacteria bacterium]|nr:SCO family protein [Gammaproteobacteria bacterium]
MASKIKTLLPAIVASVIGLSVGMYFGTRSTSTELDYADIQNSLKNSTVLPIDFKTVPEFSLLQGPDTPIDQTSLSGQWNVVVFGFTHCPDICPIALSTMKAVVEELKDTETPKPQVMFVTVDPNRDTPEVLSQYVTYFNDEFIPVSGSLADITYLIRELGVVASYTADKDDPSIYTVDHSTSMYLIDPEHRVRAKLDAPHTVDDVLADYKTLLAAFN